MRHLQVGKRTVRKTAASVGEHQIGRQSFSDVAAFLRISHLANFRVTNFLSRGGADSAWPKTGTKGGGETILLVEDDVDIRELVAAMLRAASYNVLKAESTTAALEVTRTSTAIIDLLPADIMMSEMSGVELGERVRASRPEIKWLYITGYPGIELGRRGLLESDAAILEKPFDENDLLASVRAVLDRKDSGMTSH